MASSVTYFKPGNKAAKINKGKKQLRTVVREKLVESIDDLQADVLKVWKNSLKDKSPDVRRFAAKEISKYVFSTKRENTNLNKTFEDMLRELKNNT